MKSEPHAIVLFFDELAAASAMLKNRKDKDQYNSLLKNLVLKGRSAGIQLIFSLQQPIANNLPTELREQTNIKIGLGQRTPIASSEMVFDKQENWPIPPDKPYGVGWIKTGTENLQAYETPLMENFDVHETIIPLLRKDDYFD